MSPLKAIGQFLSGWKGVGAIVAALVTGGTVVLGALAVPLHNVDAKAERIDTLVQMNTDAIRANRADIEEVRQSQERQSDLLQRIICNQDPARSYQSCELEFGGGS